MSDDIYIEWMNEFRDVLTLYSPRLRNIEPQTKLHISPLEVEFGRRVKELLDDYYLEQISSNGFFLVETVVTMEIILLAGESRASISYTV